MEKVLRLFEGRPCEESSLEESYNEFDPQEASEETLRTLEDFVICDEQGNFLPIDELGQGKSAKAVGYVVEPLPFEWRKQLLAFSASVPAELIGEAATAPKPKKAKQQPAEAGTPGTATAASEFDPQQLGVGDVLDVYCVRTFTWYQSKVLECDERRLKVHFKGWNNKFDEWVDRDSQRIAPLGTHTSETPTAVTEMVAWFDKEQLFEQVAQKLGPLPHRKRKLVVINQVEDWCVDYTYANPSVWIIGSQAWYRVAGVMTQGGPHQAYEQHASRALEKFHVAAHAAHVLLDLLPINPKANYQVVVSEIMARSRGAVDEAAILRHADFVVDQISSLGHPGDWERTIDFGSCVFINQLKKRGKKFESSGGRAGFAVSQPPPPPPPPPAAAAVSGAEAEKTPKGKKRSSTKKGEAGDHGRNGEETKAAEHEQQHQQLHQQQQQQAAEASEDSKAVVKKFPIDDAEFWKMEKARGVKVPPFPRPSSPSPFYTSSNQFATMLSVWATVQMFRELLQLPAFLPETLEVVLMRDELVIHPLLREIHVRLLHTILEERTASNWRIAVNSDKGAYGEEETTNASSSILNVLETTPITRALRFGDAWVEVLRFLVAEREEVVLDEYLDPLGECEAIVEELLKDEFSQIFSRPVNPQADGVPDYWSVVKEPIDLGTILARLHSGWYDPTGIDLDGTGATVEAGDVSAPKIAGNDGFIHLYHEGDLVDAYCTVTKRWYEARIMRVDYDTQKVEVRFNGWTAKFDEWIEADSTRLAPYRSVTSRPDATKQPPSAGVRVLEQPPPISAAGHFGGHEAVAADIERLASNAEKYFGPDHEITETAQALVEQFQEAYRRRVVLPLERMAEVREASAAASAKPSDSAGVATAAAENESGVVVKGEPGEEAQQAKVPSTGAKPSASAAPAQGPPSWKSIIEGLGHAEYPLLPLELKLEVLNWLCDEFLATNAVRKYMDAIVSTKQQSRRTSTASAKKRKRKSTDAPEQEDVSTIEQQSVADGPDADAADDDQAAEAAPAAFDERELLNKEVRWLPLGEDRDGRRYWGTNLDAKGRIFVENPRNGEWLVYNTMSEIATLRGWLCEKGVRENALKKALTAWLQSHPTMEPGTTADIEAIMNGKAPPAKRPRSKKKSTEPTDDQRQQQEAVAEAHELMDEGSAMAETPSADSALNVNTSPDAKSGKRKKPGSGSDGATKARRKRKPPREPFELVEPLWEASENFGVLLTLDVPLTSSGLGLGVKTYNWKVIVTSFRVLEGYQDNPAKLAGVRIGDQLLSVENVLIDNLQRLVDVIRHRGGKSLRITILRRGDPSTVPLVAAGIPDPDFVASWQKQCADDNTRHQLVEEQRERQHEYRDPATDTDYGTRPLRFVEPLREREPLARLRGALVMFLQNADHPYCSTVGWTDKTKEWKLAAARTPKSEQQGLDDVRKILVEQEAALVGRGLILKESWYQKRRRQKWLQLLRNCTTTGKLALATALLHHMVRWEELREATTEMAREKWLQLVPASSRNQIPVEGNRVVYFGEGHEVVIGEEENAPVPPPPMWGSSFKPIKDLVLLCKVDAIRYFACGPTSKSERCAPFCQIDLQLELAPPRIRPPAMLRPEEPRAKLSRLLGYIVRVLKTLPGVEPFLQPVNRRAFPDYAELISEPIDLGIVERKVAGYEYPTAADFMADIDLLVNNCHKYCEGRFFDLPEVANSIRSTANDLADKLADEMRAAEAEARELEDDPLPPRGTINAGVMTESTPLSLPASSPMFQPVAPSATHAAAPAPAPMPVNGVNLMQRLLPQPLLQAAQLQGIDPALLQSFAGVAALQPSAVNPLPSRPDVTAEKFTVTMRLRNQSPEFVVDFERYKRAVSRTFRRETPFKMQFADSGDGTTAYGGTIIDAKPVRPDGLVPWEWLKVEWDDGGEDMTQVNPWDVELETELTSKRGRKRRSAISA